MVRIESAVRTAAGAADAGRAPAFAATLAIVVAGGLATDRVLRLPALLPGTLAAAVGAAL